MPNKKIMNSDNNEYKPTQEDLIEEARHKLKIGFYPKDLENVVENYIEVESGRLDREYKGRQESREKERLSISLRALRTSNRALIIATSAMILSIIMAIYILMSKPII